MFTFRNIYISLHPRIENIYQLNIKTQLLMKKYLHSIGVLVLALGSTTMAWADNVVYGLIPSYTYGAQTTSVDLDKVNATEVTKVEPTGFSFQQAQEVKCGVTAGDKYYTFVTLVDDDYNETAALATFNFTTGNTVVVNNFSYSYGKPGYNATGMAYDDKNGVLYATEISFNDNDDYVTELYSVNQTDGKMTKAATFDGQYQAIASDHNGGFYLVQNKQDNMKTYASLYKVSSSFEVSQFITNTTVSTGWSSNNSMVVSEDGKTVYLVAGKNVLAFDTTNKTVTKKGELSDIVYAISYGKSTADGTTATPPAEEQKQTRFLVEHKVYGSSMGDIPDDVDSKNEFYYYNVDGKPVSSINMGREYGEYGGYTNTFTPVSVDKYTFDDDGNVTNKDTYQWGLYDFDDFAWKKTFNSESYTYNADGKLATDTIANEYHVYTYNEDGTLASVETYAKKSKAFLQKISYSNYENGHALHYTSDGAYSSYKFEADLQYDENGNKVEEFQYTQKEDPELPGSFISVGKQLETWTYEDNILRLYEKNRFDENGEAVPYLKTVYTPVDGNINEIAAIDSTYSNGTWYANGKPERYIYADFSDMDEITAMDIAMAIPDEQLTNTADLAFTMPQLAMTQNCKFVIYRNGLPIDSVALMDAYDENSGLCIYQDKNLKNGTYTYFIQPVFSSNSEFGPMSEDGEESAEEEWTGYYTTNPVDITVHTDLPAVSDLKLAGGKIETTGTFVNLQKTYYADLTWKNPEKAADYGFIKNSIYFVGAGVAEKDTADVNADKTTVMLYGQDERAYVVTSYQLGKAISDTIDIKIKDINNIATGITPVSVNGPVKVTFNGNNVALDGNANVSVFAVSGQRVYAKDNTDNVSLDNLPAATYIICVEKNGKVNAYKYNVK